MFNYKLKDIDQSSFIEYVLFSLPSKTIDRLSLAKKKDGTIDVTFIINGVELTEEEVKTAFEQIVEYYVKDVKETYKRMFQKQTKQYTKKYSDVEKEIKRRVKEQIKGKGYLLAKKINSDLARIQRQANFLRQSLDQAFKE